MDDAKRTNSLFLSTLRQIARKERGQNFSGVGMLVYVRKTFSHKCYVDLRPKITCPENVRLGSKLCMDTLLDISDEKKPLHDGFIFFNEEGLMTHLSQYFAPRVSTRVPPNLHHGARFKTAQYGSLLRGVLLTGIVSSNGDTFVFHKGVSRKIV